jgi:hypothetical protein
MLDISDFVWGRNSDDITTSLSESPGILSRVVYGKVMVGMLGYAYTVTS